jgi:UDP-N-acetylmuramate--alanine ligase
MVDLFRGRGAKISGSEILDSPVLEKFRLVGVNCRVGHSSGNLEEDTNLVVISAAIQPNNPEVAAAHSRRIPVWKYSECLGRIMGEKDGIAVAGTHGKTTTTAMVTTILSQGGLEPSYLIGGEHPDLGSARWSRGRHFVAEACEFDRSFLNLRPRMSVVTNIEEEHLDYFRSLKEIQRAFADFVSLLPEDGFLAFSRDDPNSASLSEFCRSRVATFSLTPGAADWWAEDVASSGHGTRFRMVHQGRASVPIRLGIPGVHNVRNALAAAAVCQEAGVPLGVIAAALERFRPVRRRFDVLARSPVTVVDDYAHHPTEILAVLRAARECFAGRRLTAVFQPHQHSRLKRFRSRFAASLSGFDQVVVTDVFRSRDSDEDAREVSSRSLAVSLQALGARVRYASGFSDVLRDLRLLVSPGEVVVFLGAGSITDLAQLYACEASPAPESTRGAPHARGAGS